MNKETEEKNRTEETPKPAAEMAAPAEKTPSPAAEAPTPATEGEPGAEKGGFRYEIPPQVAGHRAQMIDGEKYRESAVCIPLLEKEDGLHVLFEVRSGKIASQPGDVCFPGGMCEAGESPKEAAVRETAEELLIDPAALTFVAPSDYILAASRLSIYPFVFRLTGYQGTFSPDEVAEVFTVPLRDILAQKPEVYLIDTVVAPRDDFPFDRVIGGRQYRWRVRTEEELFYTFGGRTIWGLTARLLHAFAKTWGVTYEEDARR